MKNSQYNFILAYLSLVLMNVSNIVIGWLIMAIFWTLLGLINSFIED